MIYTYPITRFPNKKFSVDLLESEIKQNSNIKLLYNYINGYVSTCEVAFISDLTPVQKTYLDSIIASHTGDTTVIVDVDTTTILIPEPSFPISPVTGGVLVSQTFTGIIDNYTSKGRSHVAQANQLTFFDIQITTEIRLKGGSYTIKNFDQVGPEDYIELSVVDKDDALGLFSKYGLLVGTHVLELNKFLKTEYIFSKEKEIENGYQAVSVFKGLYIRLAYNNTSEYDIYFKSQLYYYE